MPAVVRLGTRAAVRNPAVMERARRSMRFLVGVQRPELDIEQLAREYVALMRWHAEAKWHVKAFGRPLPVRDVERLHGLGGVILNFMHMGPYERLCISFQAVGMHLHGMVHPNMLDPNGMPWERQNGLIIGNGGTLFPATEGAAGIVRRLDEGKVVAVAVDVPGRTEMQFVGRRVLGSFGAARVAHETGRPVVCVTAHHDAQGVHFRVEEPILPSGFPDPRALLEEMLRVHEGPVLAWPQGYEDPLGKWALPDPSVLD